MRIRYSRHAARRLAERRLAAEWVEAAIREPEYECPDPDDPDLTRAYRTIDGAGGVVIRVVYSMKSEQELLVVTAFFDADAGPLLKRERARYLDARRRRRDRRPG